MIGSNACTVPVNRPPNITWHRLRMNDTAAVLPDLPGAPLDGRLACTGRAGLVELDASDGRAFDRALDSMGAADVYETGTGPDASQWMERHARARYLLELPAGEDCGQIVVDLAAPSEGTAVLLLDVVARPGSSCSLRLQFDSPEGGACTVACRLRVAVCGRARVSVGFMQTLDDGCTYLEDTTAFAGDGAAFEFSQVELGAGRCYAGTAVNLVGFESSLDARLNYLGNRRRALDFNYVMRQRGCKTACNLTVNGVLMDRASKVLRDTIDLVHGCKGSSGNETESVLLINEGVRNKSMPVILCDEDDVAGSHGASIGHVDPSQLYYMQTRGLTDGQVKSLFANAVFDYALDRAASDAAAAGVARLARAALGEDAADPASPNL